MIVQFPVPYEDELLSSVLARFVQRLGINADKQALELLFGSRNIVPSTIFQGHIQLLLSNVGHIWNISPEQVIDEHSLLGIFKPFMDAARYDAQKQELIVGNKNQSLTSIGINASKLIWPQCFRYCPVCLKHDLDTLGETYWRRHFQLPGMSCCPIHSCLLAESDISIHSSQRHAFVVPYYEKSKFLSIGAVIVESDINQTALSKQIYRLLCIRTSCHSANQWSLYYQNLARMLNLIVGGRIDHSLIQSKVRNTWGDNWLNKNGLNLEVENNWLLAMFRKHQRSFSYLHHLAVMIALLDQTMLIEDECLKVDNLPDKKSPKKRYFTSEYDARKREYRSIWLKFLKTFNSLNDIRSTREGARVYSWLYRFDRDWHIQHSLAHVKKRRMDRRVDWDKRDRELVKNLIRIEKNTYLDLNLPRKSRPWYAKQINATNLIPDKLRKLPLCNCFLNRYQESVDEYQLRRLLAIVVDKLNHGQAIPQIYELERSAGLSKERIREPAKEILRVDILRITRQARITGGYKVNSNRRNSASS
ncbi:TnsD family Tn7-like transposition protein [Vibrio sp. 2304]|uniref:TnsD family Tn7-like transposition protein n=1 Tax=Vibrio sp. 2304 TaxID=3074601 RepID=UPI0029648DE1|nr:TnsD family Tn7-like transposition protein [Vibrio sp. 2304]MDW2001549.1 TnsD family Tn7-like transposition protein [Vibrio sp. 2304]